MAIPGYQILRKIQQGGMSTVYLARQKSVDREVAIKVMSPSLSADPSFGSRFYREARIVGKLSHQNIVSIYDVGTYKHYNYIAMDYLPGQPLQDRLEQGISDQQAIRIVREMASALDYAHSRGFIHRDIKPDNILFRADDSAVLCDFGIAKTLKGDIKMTQVGTVLGTPHYMSPEQAQGKDVDGRADIYSLGVVFFEMLSGKVPFPGDEAVAVAVKHMSSPIPKLPIEHKALQPIIDKMMEKKLSARFQSGKEVIEALDSIHSSSGRGIEHLIPTAPTTLQALGLVGALCSTLLTTLSHSFKHLMLTKIEFNYKPVQLSRQQMADLDTFILDNNEDADGDVDYDDQALIQDTLELPAMRNNSRWLYWPVGLICTAVATFIYLDQNHPEQLLQAYSNIAEPEPGVISVSPVIEKKIIKPVVPPPPPAEQAKPLVTPEPKFSLTISTTPADATIKIINIKPKYSNGIKLKPGDYHIAVSATDYFPQRRWIKLNSQDLDYKIELEPTRRLLPASTRVIDTLTDGSEGPPMIVLPLQRVIVDTTGTTLEVDTPIAIGQFEITYSDYDLFAKQTNRQLPNDFGWGRETRPVTDISYNDAKDYAAWLSKQTRQKYRLPTQAEWEYAARGGQGTEYWWGSDSAEKKANCRKGCKSKFRKLFSTFTAPVGSYDANGYGLYDNAGNVAEWLAGCGHATDSEPSLCKTALIAGGSHLDPSSKIIASHTESVPADQGSKAIGFRLVLEL